MADGKPFPPEAIDTTREGAFFLDGDKWRWQTEGPTWVNRVERVIPQSDVSMFDGKDFRTFNGIDWPDPDFAHPLGWIYLPELAHRVASMPQIAPVALLYRPFNAGYGLFDPEQWSVSDTAQPERLGDLDCLSLTFTNKRNPRGVRRCWVSPAMDYAVVRYEPARTTQVEIEYQRLNGRVVPKSWRGTQMFRDGATLMASYVFTVKSWNENVSMPEGTFTLPFPPGTMVLDGRPPAEPRPMYLVRSDGTWREISQAERLAGLTYSQVATTDTGEPLRPPGQRKSGSTWFAALTIVTAVLLSVAFYFWRVRRARSPPS
ncbi:MAG: hypothetical protein HYS13_12410 [Planctomycetia bacterium]|nr:hypothetical protein [Planctomycetia bacterium]